jgi:hypothetical protein
VSASAQAPTARSGAPGVSRWPGAPADERVFAICAALANALYVATQHVASTPGRVGRTTGLRLVASHPSPAVAVRLGGRSRGFVFQAAALKNGQLAIVQALLVTELVFGLLVRRVWIRQTIVPPRGVRPRSRASDSTMQPVATGSSRD